jgi:hypothetical protein
MISQLELLRIESPLQSAQKLCSRRRSILFSARQEHLSFLSQMVAAVLFVFPCFCL